MTLEELQTERAAWMACALAIANGAQEYRIRDGAIDRWLRRADADVVTKRINDLDRQIAALSPTRRVIYLR